MHTPLRAERERRHLTAAVVAEAVFTTQSHYSKIEKAQASASPQLANRLAKYFGNAVTRDQILYPEDYLIPSKKQPRSERPQESMQGAH